MNHVMALAGARAFGKVFGNQNIDPTVLQPYSGYAMKTMVP